MYTDKTRAELHEEIRGRDVALFSHILSPALFFQAAALCGLKIVASPLNLVNLVWLALAAARDPEQSFASLLELPLKGLRDTEGFAGSCLGQRLGGASRQRQQAARKYKSRHDPRRGKAESVSAAAFAKARQRMPTEFWAALFVLLAEEFGRRHGDVVRWAGFRLLAVDGTRLGLPDWPALRQHFGTANNAGGRHGAQARLVLLQLPLARLPVAYDLGPLAVGEVTMARRLLQGLTPQDLVLLDAGFLCYGLLCQVHRQQAFFCLRLRRGLNLRVVKRLGGANDVLVEWAPKDSRGQWRQEGLPKALTLRLLTYRARGYRPLRLLTNVLSAEQVPWEQWWGLSLSAEGEVLSRGVYNWRWQVETSYAELKVSQRLEGGLRSRTPEGVEYEVAGHVLYYLLVRWLMVEAAAQAGLSPLRLSFTEALREISGMAPQALTASPAWLAQALRPGLCERLAGHRVEERPGRRYPRKQAERRARKRARKAKPRRRHKAKQRKWFGDGWDLSGPKAQAPSPGQG
jgi:hypothetical protein